MQLLPHVFTFHVNTVICHWIVFCCNQYKLRTWHKVNNNNNNNDRITAFDPGQPG